MNKIEFEQRAIPISDEEYDAIELVYLHSDLEKDEFCKIWNKMNASRVNEYKRNENLKKRENLINSRIHEIYIKYKDITKYKDIEDILNKTELYWLSKANISVSDRSLQEIMESIYSKIKINLN